jgi:hypothetical protein
MLKGPMGGIGSILTGFAPKVLDGEVFSRNGAKHYRVSKGFLGAVACLREKNLLAFRSAKQFEYFRAKAF